jgi:hypothetical protein
VCVCVDVCNIIYVYDIMYVFLTQSIRQVCAALSAVTFAAGGGAVLVVLAALIPYAAFLYVVYANLKSKLVNYVNSSLSDDLKDISTFYMAAEKSNFWVAVSPAGKAEKQEQVLGCVALQFKKDDTKYAGWGELRRMAVGAAGRRRGIASQRKRPHISHFKLVLSRDKMAPKSHKYRLWLGLSRLVARFFPLHAKTQRAFWLSAPFCPGSWLVLSWLNPNHRCDTCEVVPTQDWEMGALNVLFVQSFLFRNIFSCVFTVSLSLSLFLSPSSSVHITVNGALLDHAKEKGMRGVFLTTSNLQTGAIGLYNRLGYR